MNIIRKRVAEVLILIVLAIAMPVAVSAKPSLPAGSRYVAMGSSFASGSGISPYDAAAPARCQRSTENYARQLARKRRLNLVDVTCGGAQTQNILRPWASYPHRSMR